MYTIKKPTVAINAMFVFDINKIVSSGTNDMYLIQFQLSDTEKVSVAAAIFFVLLILSNIMLHTVLVLHLTFTLLH